MTSNELEEALADAEDAFQRKPENPEVGLEHVPDSAVLQLRKACRLLDAAGFLLDRNGTSRSSSRRRSSPSSGRFSSTSRRRDTTSPVSDTRKSTIWVSALGCSHRTFPTGSKRSGSKTGRIVLSDGHRRRVSRRDGLLACRDAPRGGRRADSDEGLPLRMTDNSVANQKSDVCQQIGHTRAPR